MPNWINAGWTKNKKKMDKSKIDTSMKDEELINEIKEAWAETASDLTVWGRPCDERWHNLCQYAYFERGLDIRPRYHYETGEKVAEVSKVERPA
jgi:hypothetical protein